MNRMDFAISGPRCDFCNGPKWKCLGDPCKGLSDHFADIMLRVVMEPGDDELQPPLIKGGQGRRRDEVEAYANTICILALVCIVVGVAMWWGLR